MEKLRSHRISDPSAVVEIIFEDLGFDPLPSGSHAKTVTYRSKFVVGHETLISAVEAPRPRNGNATEINQLRHVEDDAFLVSHDIDVATIEFL